MIDERMQEQATLHVLGALSDTEAREFKRAMQASLELKQFVSELTVATGALAGTAPLVEPPPQLRAKVLAQVAPQQKIVTLSARTRFAWLPWSFATCLALLCAFLFSEDSQLKKQVDAQAAKVSELTQLAQSLESATNDLRQATYALQETNRLSGMRIAMLNSLLSDAPKAIAVSLWDNEKQEGVFVVQNLKPLPADKDYQLWVVDPNYPSPVSAGVFQVDEKGNVRVQFKATKAIGTANQFAVTIEPKGGLPTPTMQNMVLAGG
ncbi:MAG TPA: anti-sigma factor [Verrucomicrobiae bacterium]|jgi:anti-sigma-K factor RskA|nr:anti-sigma factor [Verrucomicrobiae bacterium]